MRILIREENLAHACENDDCGWENRHKLFLKLHIQHKGIKNVEKTIGVKKTRCITVGQKLLRQKKN